MTCLLHAVLLCFFFYFFFFKQKTAYEMRISDWSSDVCSSDLSWSNVRQSRIHCATARLLTPVTSKSAASPFACCDPVDDPTARQSSGVRNPDVIRTGLPKCERRGSRTFAQRAFMDSI